MTQEKAYKAAGFKPSRGNAHKYIAKYNIMERVEELHREATEAAAAAEGIGGIEATVERVLTEMMRMAFYNPVDVIKVLGDKLVNLAALQKLPEDLQRCIHKITPTKLGDDVYYRVEFSDKAHALDSLARHLQMFKDTVIVENVFRIVQDMSDEELDRRLAELGVTFGAQEDADPVPGARETTLH